jgi:heme-degrading monooxygenase HmoA
VYYRMIRLHWDESRYADLLAWAVSVQDRVEARDGFIHAELVRSGPDNGMIISAFESEADATAALSDGLVDEMADFLTRAPHGHEGTVVHSYGAR